MNIRIKACELAYQLYQETNKVIFFNCYFDRINDIEIRIRKMVIKNLKSHTTFTPE